LFGQRKRRKEEEEELSGEGVLVVVGEVV